MFDGYLTARISWSKNIKDDSNSPIQLLLPDMDPRTCVYLSLAVYLENWLQHGNGCLSQWLFIDGSTSSSSPHKEQDKEANRGKSAYARALKKAIEDPHFERDDDAKLGSHSIRKSACTKARENCCPRDDLDYRARWAAKRMQDNYADPQLTWPDLNCAHKLCFKGVCKCNVKEEATLDDA